MLAYAHALKADSPWEAEVATARRAQRDARAEATMVVSNEVLDSEHQVTTALTTAYRLLKRVERETDDPARESLLDEAIALLDKIVTLLSRTTVIMRLSLGVIDEPPPWFQPDPPRA
jgi:hypothetical protein